MQQAHSLVSPKLPSLKHMKALIHRDLAVSSVQNLLRPAGKSPRKQTAYGVYSCRAKHKLHAVLPGWGAALARVTYFRSKPSHCNTSNFAACACLHPKALEQVLLQLLFPQPVLSSTCDLAVWHSVLDLASSTSSWLAGPPTILAAITAVCVCEALRRFKFSIQIWPCNLPLGASQ